MTNQEIFEIMSCFDKSSSKTMKLTMKDFSLELSKCGGTASAATPAQVGVPVAAVEDSPVNAPSPISGGQIITAPMVGTFYEASEPGAAPYVAVGDRVKKGQTVCLMEAMKMISEVNAPCDCIIREILKTNGEMAEFEEALFRYEPC